MPWWRRSAGVCQHLDGAYRGIPQVAACPARGASAEPIGGRAYWLPPLPTPSRLEQLAEAEAADVRFRLAHAEQQCARERAGAAAAQRAAEVREEELGRARAQLAAVEDR